MSSAYSACSSRAYDGEEVDLGTSVPAPWRRGKLDASTAWCIGQINGCAATACAVAPEAARKIWGEPRGGVELGDRRSGPAPTRSTAATG